MTPLTKILVPIDFSEQSQTAINYACRLAIGTETELHLIHVISDSQSSNGPAQKIRTRLEKIAGLLDEKEELEIMTVKRVIAGEPFDVINAYARDEEIDLIVMGTHGRTGLSHFALGSVTERVIRTAVCPVLVMGPRQQERVTPAKAFRALLGRLGQSFEATRADGLEKMSKLLEDTFQIPAKASSQIVDKLQGSEWLTWKPGERDLGTWEFNEADFVEVKSGTVRLTDKPDSQAFDLISRAQRLRATDIHLDPGEANEIVVRLRIDGKLEEFCRLNETVGEHLQNQLKTLSDLNIAEPFLPQEGRLRLPAALSDLEVRITTARVAAGEAVALRLFDRKNICLSLNSLGLSTAALEAVKQMLQLREGLVLVTGPTGSGKTTTVYSMLEMLGGDDMNIVSIEDPVEFAASFVRQMSVDLRHGISMTSGLRTILRMDPDIVFLGEIRDVEAAQIAMRAASSGKYVVSTLHTRDVASTVTTLRDMEIGDRSCAANLTGIINQRLMRRLCQSCRKSVPLTDAQRQQFSTANVEMPNEVFEPGGCNACRNTGFRGRVGAFEVALVQGDFANAIARGEAESQLKQLLRSNGVVSLVTDALTKAAGGITSVREAMSVHWLT